MKTTLRSFTLLLPDGEEKFVVSDFATKEELQTAQEVLNKSLADFEQEASTTYTKQITTTDNEEVIANAIEKIKQAVGVDENINLLFEGTNYLDSATTIKDALIALDSAIAAK